MDKQLAAQLLLKSLKDVFAFSVSRLYDKQDAEDLTNEIIVEVLSSVERLQNDDAFYGYMWKIADNTFKRFIKAKSNINVEFNENFLGGYWETPENIYIDGEELACLRRELSLLSKQYRETTVMFYIHNKSVAEISKELKISEEMVKYYLFKTRKIFKEGVNMERKYAEKSYNPGTFAINFWGGGGDNGYVWQTFERKLPGNIVLAAYDKPLTIKELSLELGVATPYLEDELEILIRNKFIKQISDKYQTDFLIFKTPYELEFQQRIPSANICNSTAAKIQDTVDRLLPKFKQKDFAIDMDDNKLRWFVINFALINALGDFEEMSKNKFGNYPQLIGKTYGFVYGHDNNYRFNYFEGIYGCCFNKNRTAHYTAVNYNAIVKCQRWNGGNISRTERMCDAILENKVLPDDVTTAQLVSENMIKVIDGKLKANFPVFTSRDSHLMRKELNEIIDDIVSCMLEICDLAVDIFKKHTPKYFYDRCEQVCYVRHQADAMAIIIEKFVNDGYLIVPNEKTNLTMFGVKKISDC